MLANKIIETIFSVLPHGNDGILLHEPYFEGNELAYIEECIKTTYVSYVGHFVNRFEEMLSTYTGARYVIALVNGTAALHLALLLSGIRAQDEILVPSLTFVATANAVTYVNAIPHFVESDTYTLGIDPIKLEDYLAEIGDPRPAGCYNRITGRRIAAVIPMHTFGHPSDMDPLMEVCARYRIPIIEDAAESLGSYYKGRHTGTFGVSGILSFNGNKTITTGGGGALLTNDKNIAEAARHISTTAKAPHRWRFFHDQIGFNYRMPNLNAAVGCAQLEGLDKRIQRKRGLASVYAQAFDKVKGVSFFLESAFAVSNYWLNALLLDEEYAADRDAILDATNSAGIFTRPAWTPMHELPMFAESPRMPLKVCESLSARLVNIPSSPQLGPAA